MNHTTFYARRVHSLLGIVPIGLFLLEHIFSISTVLAGPGTFDETVARLAAIPHGIMLFMEICFIAIPLLAHGLYGAYIALQANNNPGRYGYMKNWQFALQRWTAWYTLFFLIGHVVYLRIMMKGSGAVINYALMNEHLSSPIIFGLYVLGVLAAVFHFCNGLTTFAMTWGIAKGPRAQSTVNLLSMGLCAVLCLAGLVSLARFVA